MHGQEKGKKMKIGKGIERPGIKKKPEQECFGTLLYGTVYSLAPLLH